MSTSDEDVYIPSEGAEYPPDSIAGTPAPDSRPDSIAGSPAPDSRPDSPSGSSDDLPATTQTDPQPVPAPDPALKTPERRRPKFPDDYEDTPVKATLIDRYALAPVADKELRPGLTAASDTMSRWRQISMKNWMEKYAPRLKDHDLEGSYRPLGEDILKKLKDATQQSLAMSGIESLADAKREAKMYGPLSTLLQGFLDVCEEKELFVVDTATHKAKDAEGHRTATVPDAGIYLNNDQSREATTISSADLKKSKMDGDILKERQGHIGRRSWPWINTVIEVKWSERLTAFHFNNDKKGFLRRSDKGEEGLGQLAEFVSKVFKNQHRTFVYAIYVFRNKARLLYFDRTGAVVSNWCCFEKDLHLQEFVYRLGCADDAQRGYDTTATRVSRDSQEVKDFIALARPESGLDEKIRQWIVDTTPNSAPIYKLRVTSTPQPPDRPVDPQEPPSTVERDFLVGRPHFSGDALVGRCTRGYVAYDLTEKKLCYLKDSWRALVEDRTHSEHEVYERLHRNSVPHIPTLVCGGDVGGNKGQQTRVHTEFMGTSDPKPVLRVHYRLVVREVCLPLEDFENFQHLVFFLRLALEAHSSACKDAKILHRDISVGNILIYIDPERNEYTAMLSDWDLCKYTDEPDSKPTQPDRTGTWPFMSAIRALFPWMKHQPCDDIESFIHVLHYLILKYHHTILPPPSHLASFVQNVYQYRTVDAGMHYGGLEKLLFFKKNQAPFDVLSNPPLQWLLNEIANICYNHYARINVDELAEKFDNPLFPKSVAPQPSEDRPKRGLAKKSRGQAGQVNIAAPRQPPLPSAGSDDLKDHSFLLRILMAAEDSPMWEMDKTVNQFERVGLSKQKSGFEGKSDFSTSEADSGGGPNPSLKRSRDENTSGRKQKVPRMKTTLSREVTDENDLSQENRDEEDEDKDKDENANSHADHDQDNAQD